MLNLIDLKIKIYISFSLTEKCPSPVSFDQVTTSIEDDTSEDSSAYDSNELDESNSERVDRSFETEILTTTTLSSRIQTYTLPPQGSITSGNTSLKVYFILNLLTFIYVSFMSLSLK